MLKRVWRLLLSAALVAAFSAAAAAKDPPADIFGVYPGLPEAEARALLNKVGREERVAGSKQNVWEVKDARVSHVIVRFKDKAVRWVIAQARADARERLRYADLADPAAARHKTDGVNHTYIWTVPARPGRTAYILVAGGRDPQFLTSYRLLRTFE